MSNPSIFAKYNPDGSLSYDPTVPQTLSAAQIQAVQVRRAASKRLGNILT